MPWAAPRLTPEQIFDSAADEIRAELRLTRRGALRELRHADAVCAQPRILAALQRGELDRTRAIVLAEGVFDLTGEQGCELLDRVLPGAATRTATGLAERVRKIAVALDPAWAERRYRAAVRDRRVIGYVNDDGSATVSGQHLPVGEAAAACDRVDALADAAKRAGAKAPLGHLRAELFLALLDGRFHQLSQEQIVAALCVQFADDSQPGRGPALSATRGVELKVGLATLMGLDEQPGEIAGWGMVTAAVARAIAARQHGGQWCYAILENEGRLLSEGTTRHRPCAQRQPDQRQPDQRQPDQRQPDQADGGSVELRVPASLLDDPDVARQHPAWARLLADLASQHTRQRPIAQDPAARFPGRPLRRRSQLRFQRCVFPGCRRPASDCDLDHRHDHARGGRTVETNLAPGCRHDHMNKTARGWRLIRVDEHTYRWISPLGRTHTVRIEPIAAPLPAPIPRELPHEIRLPDFDDPGPSFRGRTQRGRWLHPGKQPAASNRDDDPPPF
jgi:hypothetical protein